MSFETCELPGVVICRPRVFADNRGYFKEVSRNDTYRANGITSDFVQVNMSFSHRNVLRGLHYQLKFPQAKLVSVAYGRIYDIVVDCRRRSPTFGKWVGVELSAEGGEEIHVPEGFAHGFCVLGDGASVVYQCSDYYHPGDEYGLNWQSPKLAIDWPLKDPIVSEKDAVLPLFEAVLAEDLPD